MGHFHSIVHHPVPHLTSFWLSNASTNRKAQIEGGSHAISASYIDYDTFNIVMCSGVSSESLNISPSVKKIIYRASTGKRLEQWPKEIMGAKTLRYLDLDFEFYDFPFPASLIQELALFASNALYSLEIHTTLVSQIEEVDFIERDWALSFPNLEKLSIKHISTMKDGEGKPRRIFNPPKSIFGNWPRGLAHLDLTAFKFHDDSIFESLPASLRYLSLDVGSLRSSNGWIKRLTNLENLSLKSVKSVSSRVLREMSYRIEELRMPDVVLKKRQGICIPKNVSYLDISSSAIKITKLPPRLETIECNQLVGGNRQDGDVLRHRIVGGFPSTLRHLHFRGKPFQQHWLLIPFRIRCTLQVKLYSFTEYEETPVRKNPHSYLQSLPNTIRYFSFNVTKTTIDPQNFVLMITNEFRDLQTLVSPNLDNYNTEFSIIDTLNQPHVLHALPNDFNTFKSRHLTWRLVSIAGQSQWVNAKESAKLGNLDFLKAILTAFPSDILDIHQVKGLFMAMIKHNHLDSAKWLLSRVGKNAIQITCPLRIAFNMASNVDGKANVAMMDWLADEVGFKFESEDPAQILLLPSLPRQQMVAVEALAWLKFRRFDFNTKFVRPKPKSLFGGSRDLITIGVFAIGIGQYESAGWIYTFGDISSGEKEVILDRYCKEKKTHDHFSFHAPYLESIAMLSTQLGTDALRKLYGSEMDESKITKRFDPSELASVPMSTTGSIHCFTQSLNFLYNKGVRFDKHDANGWYPAQIAEQKRNRVFLDWLASRHIDISQECVHHHSES